jgi:FlaA1/EpsC-like NDP-sugar epimerase
VSIARHLFQHRRSLIVASHIVMSALIYLVAYWLRFDLRFDHPLYATFWTTLPHVIAIKLAVFFYFDLHRGLWRYASMRDLQTIILASATSTCILTVTIAIYPGFDGYPRSVILINFLLNILVVGGQRFVTRMLREHLETRKKRKRPAKRVLIAGAGDAGLIALRELTAFRQDNYEVVGFVDDASAKLGMFINGKKVMAPLSGAPAMIQARQVNELLIAMPSAPKKVTKDLVDACRGLGIKIRILPAFADVLSGQLTASNIRDIQLEDLLGRDPVQLERRPVADLLTGKVVMVTGAGGSIGSEICRQVAAYQPSRLIMLDIGETALFEIEMEMRRKHRKLMIVPALADIQHVNQIDFIVDQHRPEIILHAAAFKHVPLLEAHPVEAILNNVLGTRNLARVAIKHGVKKFLMISTDKAVRPTSVMGATKRCTEIMLQNMRAEYGTDFFAVRFGNVLGSNGSVVPLFRKQIAAGGPVTITHKDITRYFMTIPEAVELVLQSLVIGRNGCTFLLDMGEPVKIWDLAVELIELSGLVPGEDIHIVETGLRPGEKLYEELVAEGEDVQPTPIPKIKLHESRPGKQNTIDMDIEHLIKLALERNESAARNKLWSIIQLQDQHQPGQVNSNLVPV